MESCGGSGRAGPPGPSATKARRGSCSPDRPRLRHKDPGLATRKPASLYMGCGVDMLPFFFDMLRKRRLEVSRLPDRWQANACVGPFLSALLHCGGHLHDNAITKITRAEG